MLILPTLRWVCSVWSWGLVAFLGNLELVFPANLIPNGIERASSSLGETTWQGPVRIFQIFHLGFRCLGMWWVCGVSSAWSVMFASSRCLGWGVGAFRCSLAVGGWGCSGWLLPCLCEVSRGKYMVMYLPFLVLLCTLSAARCSSNLRLLSGARPGCPSCKRLVAGTLQSVFRSLASSDYTSTIPANLPLRRILLTLVGLARGRGFGLSGVCLDHLNRANLSNCAHQCTMMLLICPSESSV